MDAFKVFKPDIVKALKSFQETRRDPRKIWEELVFCLCTPQTKARNALIAVDNLKKMGLIERPEKNKIAFVLKGSGVRFHKTKAMNIVKAFRIFPTLAEKIETTKDVNVLRDYLINNVEGFGMKEASHFLRNIGYDNVAIIDRHILRFLHAQRLVSRKPKHISKKQYLILEKKLREYSEKNGLSMSELDLLIWAVSTGEVLK